MSDQPPLPPPPPAPLVKLLRQGWPAVFKPYREFAGGEITYERALADTLDQVVRDWDEFWKCLQCAAPIVAIELGRKMIDGRRLFSVPLDPKGINPK